MSFNGTAIHCVDDLVGLLPFVLILPVIPGAGVPTHVRLIIFIARKK